MSGQGLDAASRVGRCELGDGQVRGVAARRVLLGSVLVGVLLLGVASVAKAATLYWYGENNSTCWQTGFPGNTSSSCDTVGPGYLAANHMREAAIGGDVELVNNGVSGDYCNYYHLHEGLDTTNENEQGRFTGFNPPTPYGSYQESNHYNPPDVCQADGTNWGQVVRGNKATNECKNLPTEPEYAPCGMQHFAALGAQGTNEKPWSSSLGSPSLVISAEDDPYVIEAPNSWGYLCLLLKTPSGAIVEYCLEEWHVGSGSFPSYKHYDEAGPCNFGAGQVFTGFSQSTKFAQLASGSSETFEYKGNPGHRTFAARITLADLEAAVAAVQEHGCGAQSHSFSEYALVGIEQGVEGGGLSMIGNSTAHLQVWSEYTPLPPEATTNAASGLQPVQATLNGTVNPKATDTHYYFEYGPTTSYGQDAPVSPGTDAGSGASALPVSATAARLQPNAYYHYRLVATNSEGATAYGADKTFTTQIEQSGSSWAQRETGTQETWLYIPDSGAGVSAWYWDHGWSESSLASLAGKAKLTAEDEIAPGTVPTTLREPSTSETWVYFQNKNHGISAWGWFPGVGWTVTELPKASLPEGESEAAAGTSPTATREPSTSATWVYFQNKQGGISAFEWSPGVGWTESVLPGSKKEEAASGASPTVVREPSTQETWVYFPNKTGGISAWYWKAGAGWSVTELPRTKLPEGESEVAGGTSPTVVREPSTSETWAYFQNKQGGISAFDWSPGVGWSEMVLPGSKEEVASGTSPSVVREPSTSETWVYFQNKNHGVSGWYWNDGWSVMELPGGKGEVAATASPAVLREHSNSETWVYFENKAGGMSGFNWSIEGKGWHLSTL
jgi:hypothetical protein